MGVVGVHKSLGNISYTTFIGSLFTGDLPQ